MAGETRPMRMCDSCGQVDDHPRHVFATADGAGVTDATIGAKALRAATDDDFEAILAQVQDGTTIMKHMDCCRADGCPDGSCNTVTAGAEDKTGAALVKHLTSYTAQPEDTEAGGVVAGARNDDEPFAESTVTSTENPEG